MDFQHRGLPRSRTSSRRKTLLAGLCIALPSLVSAGDWEFTPRISTNLLYTDNARFAGQGGGVGGGGVGAGEQSDVIAQIRPGISVRGESRRLEGSLDYNLDKRESLQGVTAPRIQHQLRVDGTLEAIERHVFVDLDVLQTQVNTDNAGVVTFDNRLGDPNNSRTVQTITLAPYARFGLGSFADSQVRGTFRSLRNDGNQNNFSNSQSRGLDASLTGGDMFGRFRWNLTGSQTAVENDRGVNGSTTRDFSRTNLNLGYQISSTWLVDADVGYEENSLGNGSTLGGGSYLVGARFTPNERVSADFSIGERYFGRTFDASVDYSRRHTTIGLTYNEQVQTVNQAFGQLGANFNSDFANAPVIDPTNFANLGVRTDTLSLNDRTFLNKRLAVFLDWTRRRNNVNLNFFQNSRADQEGVDPQSQLSTGITARYARNLSRAATFSVTGSWNSNSFAIGTTGDVARTNPARSDNLYRIQPSYSYRLSEHLSMSLNYTHVRRVSDNAASEYSANSVNLGLNFIP